MHLGAAVFCEFVCATVHEGHLHDWIAQTVWPPFSPRADAWTGKQAHRGDIRPAYAPCCRSHDRPRCGRAQCRCTARLWGIARGYGAGGLRLHAHLPKNGRPCLPRARYQHARRAVRAYQLVFVCRARPFWHTVAHYAHHQRYQSGPARHPRSRFANSHAFRFLQLAPWWRPCSSMPSSV